MGRAEWRVQAFCPQDKTLAQAEFISAEHFKNKGSPSGLPDGGDATGFINLWGLPDTVQALREQGKLK